MLNKSINIIIHAYTIIQIYLFINSFIYNYKIDIRYNVQ